MIKNEIEERNQSLSRFTKKSYEKLRQKFQIAQFK